MKKMLLMLLMAVSVVGFAAGCNNGEDMNTENNTEENSANNAEENAE